MTLQWKELLAGLTLKHLKSSSTEAQNCLRILCLGGRPWQLLCNFGFTWAASLYFSLKRSHVKHCTQPQHFCTVTVGTQCLRCDCTVSTGQLSGALCPDGAVPRPYCDPPSPALVPDQLAFLGLPASVSALPDLGQVDPVWIRHNHTGHRCGLRRRLVPLPRVANQSHNVLLYLIRTLLYLNAPLKQQIWRL